MLTRNVSFNPVHKRILYKMCRTMRRSCVNIYIERSYRVLPKLPQVIKLLCVMNARARMLVVVLSGGVLSLLRVPPARGTVEVMKDVTLGFGEALKHCREESQLSEDMMEEFFHFWSEDFKFEHRELGCAIMCMSRYFNLLTDSRRMHHDNTKKFIKSFPNGEVLAHQMVDIIHTCEKQHDAAEDHCWRILRVAECFKGTCQRLGIAPDMELIMAEFIMEAEAR